MKKIPFTTDSFIKLKLVETIEQLKKLKPLKTYITYNYGLFKFLAYNRGLKSSIQKNRLKRFKELHEKGNFIMECCHVEVNFDMIIIDGHHRFEFLKSIGAPITFQINPSSKFNNVSLSELLNNVSLRNGLNPVWGDNNNFLSARDSGERCARNVDTFITLAKSLYGIKLTPNMMIGITDDFKLGNKNAKRLRNVYCDNNYANIMETKEFEEKFKQILTFMGVVSLKNKNIRKIAVIRTIVRDINAMNGIADWNDITLAFNKYLRKNKRDFVLYGDKQYHFNKISDGIIDELIKLKRK